MKGLYIYALNLISEPNEELTVVRDEIDAYARPLQGCYKGDKENSYISTSEQLNMNVFRDLLLATGQESILFLDEHNQGYLYFQEDQYNAGPNSLFLGTFKAITREEAEKLEAYTYCPKLNEYYACI